MQNNKVAYTRKTGCPTYNFSVVIVQHSDGRFLAVNETRNRGWWLPAGSVEPGETFVQSALRETLEEGGIKIKLEGILRVEHSISGAFGARMRVIFYARPLDNSPPKSVPDEESEGAAWVTYEELCKMKKQKALRGDELLIWSKYLLSGGYVYPLTVLTDEDDPTHSTDKANIFCPNNASIATSNKKNTDDNKT